jgi:manganese oxidase
MITNEVNAARLHPDRPACRSPLRHAAAAAAVVAAAAHLPLVPGHLLEAPYMGGLFVLVLIAFLVEAWLLLRHDAAQVWAVTGLTATLAVLTYATSRMVALPQLADDVGRWAEPLGLVALAAEGLLAVLAVTAVFTAGPQPSTGPVAVQQVRAPRGGRPALAGAVVLALGLAGSGVATAASTGVQSGATNSTAMAGMAGMTAGSTGTGAGYWSSVSGGGFRPNGRLRTYYIQTDEVDWDYAPTGSNQITGQPFDDTANVFVRNGVGRIGSKYTKCLYRGYTDGSFHRLTPVPEQDRYLGFQGPVIRAEVGDVIRVVFRNRCAMGTSVHPHGVFYRKDSEGAPYNDGTSGAKKEDDDVPPGGSHLYNWEVPDRAGPGPHDGSSVMWMYHSHTDEVADTYAGLMGSMVVTARGMARPDGSPKDVDREIFTLFSVMNENLSPYLQHNLETFAQPPFPPLEDEEFGESNLMHSINGYVFGNQPMITVHRGQRVRWYVMGMGTEVDLHTPHWHGNVVTVGGMRMDVVNLLPASMVVADMVPDNPGVWLFHCHVNDHISAGMMTRYQVLG